MPITPLTPIRRLEGAVIAATAMTALILAGFAWWWPLALFLVFDLSMLGYAFGLRVGAFTYNLVHHYLGPVLVATSYAALATAGHVLPSVGVLAASWAFHVGVDRALGYGPRPTR